MYNQLYELITSSGLFADGGSEISYYFIEFICNLIGVFTLAFPFFVVLIFLKILFNRRSS